MASSATNVIQHDFGFPRVVRAEEAEIEALYAMLVSLGATKMMADRLMVDFPRHGLACQAIVDFASDGEGDIRGARSPLSTSGSHGGAGRAGRRDLGEVEPLDQRRIIAPEVTYPRPDYVRFHQVSSEGTQ
jgi:hypothetical protein